jgi:hypothetical protein
MLQFNQFDSVKVGWRVNLPRSIGGDQWRWPMPSGATLGPRD